MQTPLWRY